MNMFRFNLWPRPFLHPGAPQGLEGTPFFPNPLALPPSLAFANAVDSAKSALQDKDKDSAIAYSTALPLFRPGDPIPPAALYSPIHQQFLRAHMELANAHSREHQSHVSAFAPAKRSRTEGSISPRSAAEERIAESPSSHDVAPPRSSLADTLPSPGSHVSRTSTPRDLDDVDDRRSNSASEALSSPGSSDGLHCPICRCALAAEDMAPHIAKEMHELRMMGNDNIRFANSELQFNHSSMPTKSRYETFMRIRGNREHRLAKLRGIRRKRAHEDDSYFMNGHDDSFISKKDEDEQIDILSCDDADRNTSDQHDFRDGPQALSRKCDVAQSPQDALSCAGCMTSFKKVVPITSTNCWHVRCENCWQESQEQCPQCQCAMTADNLRRIYI